MKEDTDVGPLITESAARSVEEMIREACSNGASLLTGGDRKGSMVEPAILEGVGKNQKIYRQEVFGPVTLLEPYEDFDRALAAVNDSDYGLQAGLFTRDAYRIRKAFECLEVGGLVVGQASAYRIDHQPYGGAKDSGFGREGVRYAMEEMTERKVLIVTT